VTVALSVVVVVHDMARELPRTLLSLSAAHQVGIAPGDHEIVVVDNGSTVPVDPSGLQAPGTPLRVLRLDPAPASPAAAANRGIEEARGSSVGLIVDGARMASPGLLAAAAQGLRLAERAVVATLGWHLGPVRHGHAAAAGYDQVAEDALLERIGWPEDGYRLFEVSTLAESSSRGWFGPLGESSALFMPAALWHELGGLDTSFALPGGGLVNHDLYRRALEAPGTELVVLLGEGTFHQVHGGAATSGRFGWEEMQADHVRLRGRRAAPPTQDPTYLGRIPPSARRHLVASAEWLVRHEQAGTPAARRRWGRLRRRDGGRAT
jgi:hypothetical protein